MLEDTTERYQSNVTNKHCRKNNIFEHIVEYFININSRNGTRTIPAFIEMFYQHREYSYVPSCDRQ